MDIKVEKRLCKCGCGEEIIILPIHKWKGNPKYINHHYQTMSGQKNRKEWFNANNVEKRELSRLRKNKRQREYTRETTEERKKTYKNWYKKNKERVRLQTKKWRNKNRDRVNYNVKKYWEDNQELLNCSRWFSKGSLYIDIHSVTKEMLFLYKNYLLSKKKIVDKKYETVGNIVLCNCGCGLYTEIKKGNLYRGRIRHFIKGHRPSKYKPRKEKQNESKL